MFPKIDSYSNIPANFKIFKKFQKFQNDNIFKKFKKNSVFIKFQNFNIEIIILKNDKTIIAYFFPVFKKIKQL